MVQDVIYLEEGSMCTGEICELHCLRVKCSQFSSVQSLSCVRLCDPINCGTPSLLSIANTRTSFKLMSIKSVRPSTNSSSVVPFSFCRQSFSASGSFPTSQLFT